MNGFAWGVVLGALAMLAVRWVFAGRLAPRSGTGAPPSEPAPPALAATAQRLYALSQAVVNAPQPALPDELLQVAPFLELIELMSSEAFSSESLLGYAAGDRGIPAWAALCVLARRPGKPEYEARLLARINLFHPWTRHFLLRALEAWSPADPTLAGRVLLRLDDSWEREDFLIVLEDFLRRRAAAAPLSLDGLERPDGFDAGDLRDILKQAVDPALVAPLLEQLSLEVGPVSDRSAPWRTRAPAHIGRVRAPGKVTDAGLCAFPSADVQLGRLIDTLAGPRARSALVVGESGVGKSVMMRRVAAALSRQGWTILEAGALELNAGAIYIGELEAHVQSLIRQLSRGRTLWVAPDFHQLLYAGRHRQNPSGALDLLLPAIESGEIRVLGEIRPTALDRVLSERPDLGRVVELVRLEPPTPGELDGLLHQWAEATRPTHRVEVAAELRREAAALARQYLSSLTAPGGVLRLLDDAVTAAIRRAGPDAVAALRHDDLLESLARLTGMPLAMLDERRALDLEALRRQFESRVIGQTEAVSCLVERMALIKAGITDPTRPYGVFLCAGGSGTGKTELAKTCAELLYGAPDRLHRIDMSELQDPQSVDRIVGRGDSGQTGHSLIERVRRQPFAVVLLDEFEKAHPRVWDLFLQVFDDGRLSDHSGETADFRHSIILLTSNLGTSDSSAEVKLGLVGESAGFSPTGVTRAIERAFRPELLNRLDRILVFRPLTRDVMRQILGKELTEAFERRGLRRRDWAIELDESALQRLIELGFSARYGARPLKRALERLLLAPLARAIVDHRAPEGGQFLFVRADGDRLAVEFVDPEAAPEAQRAAAPFDGSLAVMVYEPRGTHAEVVRLRETLEALKGLVDADDWRRHKRELLAELSAEGFWERADRHDRLGRAEYLDRIDSALRSATSLLERLEGGGRTPRPSAPREMVRRLAQSLFLLDAACHEALDSGPREAFVSIEPMQESGELAGSGRDFAARLAAMYEAWARARGMRFAALEPHASGGDGTRGRHLLSIAGFAAYSLLLAEQGVHVLEPEGGDVPASRRPSVRVRVLRQPPEPAGSEDVLRAQALTALAAAGAPGTTVVRRYRMGPQPLVRDSVRRWRTGRADRVLAGEFDVIPGDDELVRGPDGDGAGS